MSNTGKENSGYGNNGHGNSGYGNSGDWNSGDWNSGNGNSGHGNSGYGNSGHGNSGFWNSGYENSGSWNSGNRNSGSWNSGQGNSGTWNSGDWNSGHGNSGAWNACDYETGAFNTTQSGTIRVFNKECSRGEWAEAEKPSFLFFNITEWISENDMSDEEKKANPDFHVKGGYLKTYEYKKAFQKAYNEASQEERAKLWQLPNFDPDVFYEISGIDVRKEDTCAGKIVEIEGKKYRLEEV